MPFASATSTKAHLWITQVLADGPLGRITDDNATNEMVRRLLPLSLQRIVSSSSEEDHCYADSFRWYRPGQDDFHLVALGAAGKVLVKRKFTQKQLLAYTANLQTSLIGLEACAGAHFLGRALRKQGHDVRLIPGQFVKPFVKSNKNDFVDAEAIAEAVERKNMRFVPIKTDDQLDLQAIHRVRDRLISRRTAVINQIRAFLLERGLVFAKRPAQLKAAMADVLENAEADLTPMMRNLINTMWDEWKTVEQQIGELGEELERISAADAGCTRIRQIPGVGPVVATAIVAAIGNGAAFRKGRDFAALGIVPRQYSTGGKARLFSISKRGNVYLRKMLIHGARAAVLRVKRDRAPFGPWLDRLDARAHTNVVVVAMANKLARIAWAVLSSGNDYRSAAVPA